jgi:cytochrome c-type biogenesis protein CcmF
MTAMLGTIMLWLALAAALVQSVPRWARAAASAQALLVALAFAGLVAGFVRNDFTLLTVAEHSNTSLPLAYRIAAVWGGHEGSMLLWLVMLSLWTLAFAQRSHALPPAFAARVLAVLGWISAGLLLFVLFTSSPFERVDPPPPDGNDLNPLLQHPAMVLHPPLLYTGYVGFAVAFAFAVAALCQGSLDAAWARWLRPWACAAWAFLTVGIGLGSVWAYEELGWGGWWFWDPVENASFMPWLAGTALIHSLAATGQCGAFKAWSVLLAIAVFALSLLGTFLVRSGVLSSVHAFAADPRRGLFILVLLALVAGGSLALYAWRAPRLASDARFAPLSRESLLLVNNLLLVVALLTVLLGTLYPLLLDALGLGKISVGAPYFDTVFVPLMLPLLALLGAAPAVAWKRAPWPELARRLRVVAGAAVAVALVIAWLAGGLSLGAALGVMLSAWIVAALARDLRRMPSRATLGMLAAHLGVAAFAFGVSTVKTLETQRELVLHVGDSVELAGHRFTLHDVQRASGANYDAMQARIDVTRNGDTVATLRPERRVYRVRGTALSEAAIDRGITRDLYATLGEAANDAWLVRLHVKPFIAFIWAGCVLMALGGAVAASDRRFRARQIPAAAAAEAGA